MIEIDNVSYRYEDAKRAALSDVTLNIPKGEFLAIVEIGRASCRERV